MKVPLFRLVVGSAAGVFAALAGWLGYSHVRSDIREEVYRQKLAELAGEYESLRGKYNEAVTRSAVTELVVGEDHRLSVRIVSEAGVLEEVETPYLATGEVYIDYALIDGRLLIRRVFDEHTPPSSATVIDPDLEYIDWRDEGASFGKAVYRSLEPGRWIVSITGAGSLGLTRLADGEEAELIHAPEVRDYETIEKQIDAEMQEIRMGEVFREVVQ